MLNFSRAIFEKVPENPIAGELLQSQSAYELLSAPSHHGYDLMSLLLEKPQHKSRLVSSYATGDAQENLHSASSSRISKFTRPASVSLMATKAGFRDFTSSLGRAPFCICLARSAATSMKRNLLSNWGGIL